MKYLVLICVATLAINVEAQLSIEDNISKYFKSETEKAFQDEWAKYKKSSENAVSLSLQGIIGNKNLNIFLQKSLGAKSLARGFYLKDNVIDLLLSTLVLRHTPKIKAPDVSLALSNNVLRVEGAMFKMFIDAEYVLFRNKSAVTYPSGKDQNNVSPFSFQQVSTNGQVTIIAEYCNLVGVILTKLSGQSIVLGQTSLRVSNCRFTVEVYHSGTGQPPMISRYFSRQKSLQLESLLSMRVVDDVLPQLQATVFNYINTTAMFGENLPKYRHMQEKLFKQTADYMAKVVRALNKFTVDENQGRVKIDDLVLGWDDPIEKCSKSGQISLVNMTLNGLDTAFSSNAGGAFRLTTISIADELRFSTLVVRGQIRFKNETYTETGDFGIDIKDFSVLLKLRVDEGLDENYELKPAKELQKFQLLGWRSSAGFSAPNIAPNMFMHPQTQSLVSGYLVTEIPRLVIKHISGLLSKAISNTRVLKKKKPHVKVDKCKNEIKSEEEDVVEEESNEYNVAEPNSS